MNRVLITHHAGGGYQATELLGSRVVAVNIARDPQMIADLQQFEWPVGTVFRWFLFPRKQKPEGGAK